MSEKPLKEKKVGRGGAREGAGRKPFEPTDQERRQVEALSGYGLPQEQITVLIRDGISLDTLRKYFANELMIGKAKANGQIGKILFEKAASGDTTAMIWWTKTQMRWSETMKQEISGPNGGAIQLSDDEAREQLKALLAKASASNG